MDLSQTSLRQGTRGEERVGRKASTQPVPKTVLPPTQWKTLNQSEVTLLPREIYLHLEEEGKKEGKIMLTPRILPLSWHKIRLPPKQ